MPTTEASVVMTTNWTCAWSLASLIPTLPDCNRRQLYILRTVLTATEPNLGPNRTRAAKGEGPDRDRFTRNNNHDGTAGELAADSLAAPPCPPTIHTGADNMERVPRLVTTLNRAGTQRLRHRQVVMLQAKTC